MKQLALPSYPMRAVHLTALWAYAVAQPVFSLLDANPEFLVVRGSSRAEIVAFSVVLMFGPPLLAVASQVLVGMASRRAADLLHLAVIGAFVLPLAFHLLTLIEPSIVPAVAGAVALATLAVTAYLRFRAVGLFLAFSSVLPLVGLYLFASDVRLAPRGEVASANVRVVASTPIVLVVFDEFPASSLLASDGSIDEQRYPNFARLARRGTWYSAATTVADNTTHAVPAILDGKLPDPGSLPTVVDHPGNLFTLLGESYRFRVVEPITHLCPRPYCPRDDGGVVSRLRSLAADVRVAYLHRVLPGSLAAGLPPIGGRWAGFADRAAPNRERILGARNASEVDQVLGSLRNDPVGSFEQFLASIQRGQPAGSFHFLHLLLPHGPWRFLPSGREYTDAPGGHGTRQSWDEWRDDPWLVQQGYQRHLLQVGYTDRLIGRLLRRLEVAGLYDDSLVVVASDHGASFVPGGRMREVNDENLADIARVLLFVKYPGQTEGRVDARAARTVDILPTIADALGVELPWEVHGNSLLGPAASPATVTVMRREGGVRIRATRAEVDGDLRATVRRKASLFGDGADSLFRIGVNRRLLGRVVQDGSRRSVAARVHFDDEGLVSQVRRSSSFVPALIAGYVEGLEIPADAELAVAVNGRIAALTRCFREDGRQRFRALVPETAFRHGSNSVALFLIEERGDTLVVTQLGESAAPR